MIWDDYFHMICAVISSKSPCLSRKIGAVIVRDNSIVSTGYNGPPRGVPHCGADRWEKDPVLYNELFPILFSHTEIKTTCPRRLIGFESGQGMEWCPAQHAEENAISNAARLGVNVVGTTLYMNCVIPCQKCLGTLINAGISEIVVESTKLYDKHTQFLLDHSNLIIREFSK